MLKYNPLMYIHLPTYADQIKPRLQTKPSGPSDKKPQNADPRKPEPMNATERLIASPDTMRRSINQPTQQPP